MIVPLDFLDPSFGREGNVPGLFNVFGDTTSSESLSEVLAVEELMLSGFVDLVGREGSAIKGREAMFVGIFGYDMVSFQALGTIA